jgi:serine O-acetyltransferase
MINRSWEQMRFLGHELNLQVNGRWWRWLSIWFGAGTWALITYRVERALFLLLGRAYGLLRIALLPLLFITRPWQGNCEIHYRANIGKGLKILHPSLGVVVNANTVCGEYLTLTGGNCIGGRESLQEGDISLGSHVSLGANAVILGPIRLGSHVMIGAGAVVIHDAPDHATLVGVPARALDRPVQKETL